MESKKGEIIIYQTEDARIDVRLENENIWLTQAQMAELFQTDRTSIVRHINNIYKTDELTREATCAKIAQVQTEGSRQVTRVLPYFNLDMIISVGYRVNSKRGIKFRQWAMRVLKEYLLRGLVRDQRIGKLEKRMTAAERSIDTIIYTLMPALPENRKPICFHK